MATIRQRKPGVWEVRVFTGRGEDGVPTQISRTVHGTKRDAQRVAASYESRPAPSAAGRTVADALDAWVQVNDPVWAETTRRDNAGRAEMIKNDLIAKIPLARLGISDVEQWHARMRKVGVGEGAIRIRHSALRAALGQAVRWGWVNDNAARNARLRQPKKAPREAMSVDEVSAVLAAAATVDPAAALALRIAAVAGARRAELAALRWADVEGDQLTIWSSSLTRIDATGTSVRVAATTKTANRRTVRLDESTLRMIEVLREQREQLSPYMFSIDEHPAPAARIGWWWTRARALAGIDEKWRLHDLRHWSATMAISAGHDIRTVAGRLGHANPAMTLRTYAHVLDKADREVASALGNILDGTQASG